MVFQKTTFTRLFPAAPSGTGLMTYTSFGFESDGKRFYDVTVPGKPRIEQGMTVIALLETPSEFGGNGLLGWVDCQDGSIVCDSAIKYFCMFLLCAFFAIIFPIRAYAVISDPENAMLVAAFVATMFGAFAAQSLYFSAKALLVKRSLVTVRDLSKQNNVEWRANTSYMGSLKSTRD